MIFKVGDKVYIGKKYKKINLDRRYIYTIKRINSDKTYVIENELFIFKNVPEKYLGEKLWKEYF